MGAQTKINDIIVDKLATLEGDKSSTGIPMSLIPLSGSLPKDFLLYADVWTDFSSDLEFLEEVLLLSLGPRGLVKAQNLFICT